MVFSQLLLCYVIARGLWSIWFKKAKETIDLMSVTDLNLVQVALNCFAMAHCSCCLQCI